MFDINLLREQPELVRQALQNRQMDAGVVDEVLALEIGRASCRERV